VTEKELLQQLHNAPETIRFEDSMAVIDNVYMFSPTAFTNGDLENAAGENNGSCKVFSFAKQHALDTGQTLNLFGDYYRKDVIEHPNGVDHQNIRNFIRHGWEGVQFEKTALNKKNNR
jgi:HopJ type III effector protein